MKLEKLLNGFEYEIIGNKDVDITTLVYDSRKVEEGSLFVCMVGAAFNAHDFIDQVIEKGAHAIVISQDVPLKEGMTYIRVKDTRIALALLSCAYFNYPSKELKVVGITGTKGKTSSSLMIKSILEHAGKKVGIIGTNGTFIGDIHNIVKDIAKISNFQASNMETISYTTEELTKSTELIAMSSMDVAEGSMTQNTKLDELNDLVIKIKNHIENVSNKAKETLISSEESQKYVRFGDKQVEIQSRELGEFVRSIKDASVTVEELNHSSEAIKTMVDLIHNVSSQTNLLALNASIEAARAGEAGRGFAVVADEIRKLAEETSSSAQKISTIVDNIGDRTISVKVSMDELVDRTKIQEKSMDTLKDKLKDILVRSNITVEKSKDIMEISSELNQEFNIISESAAEIKDVAIQNSSNTQDVASAVEEQTASFEEVSSNISSLSEMAQELKNIVSKFKI